MSVTICRLFLVIAVILPEYAGEYQKNDNDDHNDPDPLEAPASASKNAASFIFSHTLHSFQRIDMCYSTTSVCYVLFNNFICCGSSPKAPPGEKQQE